MTGEPGPGCCRSERSDGLSMCVSGCACVYQCVCLSVCGYFSVYAWVCVNIQIWIWLIYNKEQEEMIVAALVSTIIDVD